MKLYLDSLIYIENNFYNGQSCKVEERKDVRQSVWTRLTMPIHAALMLIRAVGSQTIRGTASNIAGIFTLDPGKIKSGFIDYISVITQVIALPIIGLIAPFSPNSAKKILKWFLKSSFEDTQARPGKSLKQHFVSQSSHPFAMEITILIRGIIAGIPMPIIDGLTNGISKILSGKNVVNQLSLIGKRCICAPFVITLCSLLGFDPGLYSDVINITTHALLDFE